MNRDGGAGPAMRRWGAPVVVAVALVIAVVVVLRARPVVRFEAQGRFGTVRVDERPDGLRELTFDGGPGRQSAVYPRFPLRLVLPYSRVAMIGPALVPPDARMLFVGLGGGAMPTFVHLTHPDADIDVVEIDSLVVAVAREWFGFRPDASLRVHVGDGRAFIEAAAPGSWDLVVLDAFSADGIPRSLTTRPFLEAVRASLAPGGVVVSNLHTAAPEYPSMVATYAAVFAQVAEVDVPARRQRILVAGGREVALDRAALEAAALAWRARVQTDVDLPAYVVDGYRRPDVGAGAVLEDGG